jgi:hypothetical protein
LGAVEEGCAAVAVGVPVPEFEWDERAVGADGMGEVDCVEGWRGISEGEAGVGVEDWLAVLLLWWLLLL